ncbi:uroporphyrinogen-III synthase, partial [Slackia exigua]
TQASAFTRRLEALGAQVVEVPTIDIAPPESFDALDASLNALDGFSWVVFTSANGVEAFFERLRRRTAPPHDARALAYARIAAIGPATADALRAHGIEADAVPHEYRAEAVFDAMRERGLDADDAVLIPRAQVAREALPEMLAGIGCAVTVAPAYRTVVPGTSADAARAALADGVDAVTFTSSSTAENLVALLGDDAPVLLADARLFSIGPITTATLERLGFPPASTASSYTIPGLVDTLLEAFASPDETASPRKDHR